MGVFLRLALGAFTLAWFATRVDAAAVRTDVYVTPSIGPDLAYLVDWKQDHRARVSTQYGSSEGTYAGKDQRVVTLDKPPTLIGEAVDSCDELISLRQEFVQLVVRETGKRTAATVEIWKFTNIGGCQDGLVRYFGSPDEPGVAVERMPLEKRLAIDDLVPGTVIAGFSEDVSVPLPGESWIAEDVVTFQPQSAVFRASGNAVPVRFNDRWVIFSLNGVERAYARLKVNEKNGAETWLRAELERGVPQRVNEALLVKPVAGAGFGNAKRASRVWNALLYPDDPTQLFHHFYPDGTGERVVRNDDIGYEVRVPISWRLESEKIVSTRFSGPTRADRTWEPLRDVGRNDHWVLDNEVRTDSNGNVTPIFKPRVNLYDDTGKAVRP